MKPEANSVVRTVVTGAAGRMGRALVRCVRETPQLQLVGATVRTASDRPDLGSLVPMLGEQLASLLKQSSAHVVIDFTDAAASLEHARICAEHAVALVIGSTGLTDSQKGKLRELAQKTPIVAAPNMSVGVNVMLRAAADLARALGDSFDIEIVETHHRMKKDAPSGTALRLAEDIAAARGVGPNRFKLAREGQIGERPRGEIGIQTLRGGDVVGDHTVFFLGDGERLELSHRASSRDQFAKGAVRAAEWVIGRAPALYDMQDVLGLRR